MLFLIVFFYFIVNFINISNGYGFEEAKTEKGESFCTKILVSTSDRAKDSFWWTTRKTCSGIIYPSFQGPQVHPESQSGLFSDGQLSMAVQLWTPEWQASQFLPGLPMENLIRTSPSHRGGEEKMPSGIGPTGISALPRNKTRQTKIGARVQGAEPRAKAKDARGKGVEMQNLKPPPSGSAQAPIPPSQASAAVSNAEWLAAVIP